MIYWRISRNGAALALVKAVTNEAIADSDTPSGGAEHRRNAFVVHILQPAAIVTFLFI